MNKLHSLNKCIITKPYFKMKKILILPLILLISIFSFGQAPEGFNYQAVARDGSGDLLKNKSITIKTVILSGAGASKIVYQETHALTTNEYGHFNLIVGKGSTSDDFSSIEWNKERHSLKVELDQGSGFTVMGTVELQSVPYALHSKTAENVANLNVSTSEISDVTSDGAATGNVLKWNGTKWAPGDDNSNTILSGVGISVVGSTVSALNQDELWNANKLQGNALDAKSPVIGQTLIWNGTSWVNGDVQEYKAGSGLELVNDSFKAKTEDAIWNAGSLRGISLSTTVPTKDQILQYNGTEWIYAAASSGSGSSNWTKSGSNIYYKSTTGNVGINHDNPLARLSVRDSLLSTSTSFTLSQNYLYAGGGTTSQFVGERTVVNGSKGYSNVAALNVSGGEASKTNGESIGTWSVADGDGQYNIASYNSTGPDAITQSVGSFNSVKANSTYNVGVYASANKTNTGTNYGVFAVGDSGTTNYAGYFLGNVTYTGTLLKASDRKLKHNVNKIGGATSLIMSLSPKTYYYKQDGEAAYLNLSKNLQYGFIAQEVEKVLPTLVMDQVQFKGVKQEGDIEYKAVNYVGLIPVLTQAIKEQQELILKLEQRILSLEQAK